MSSAPLVFNIIIACLITLIFLYRCGNYRRQHPVTTGAVYISWAFSALFIFLIPLDISSVNILFHLLFQIFISFLKAAYRECLGNSTISTTTVSTITTEDLNQVKKILFI